MKYTILKQFGSGQITIPKKWRGESKEQFWRARQRGRDIVLSPVADEDDEYGTELYEDKKGFGLRFKKGIPADEFLKKWRQADSFLKKVENGKMD